MGLEMGAMPHRVNLKNMVATDIESIGRKNAYP